MKITNLLVGFGVSVFASISVLVTPVLAQNDDMDSHERAVLNIMDKYDVDIGYDYIATLMRLPNAFGEGAACIVCHNSNDEKHSPRGLNLSTCEGILKGATEAPAQKIVAPGDGDHSLIRSFIRDNRMPFGVSFDVPTNLPAILAVKKWIDDGAKNDNFFKQTVLPSFKDPTAYGGSAACVECHMSNQEPPSFHELNLSSYDGVMLGADAIAKKAEGLPAVKIVIPGDSEGSKLYQRLVRNRMPAGIDPGENRDHPNLQVLLRWINKGAKCE
ncbi:hypothetical protein [Magnetovibrio blakemorei]|uniref:Cytochrome c domain-containing protein n=1 Tax=Magnetovibrio blakemorei TaxID=28181 RepID=A0A1E5Q6Y2_9PROT|nr:hypothetical protein [Magnetovibrio blakemorei]OEJ66721.1 hypothetical protein BEN30_11630 [Magnetovibrio blakemorei]